MRNTVLRSVSFTVCFFIWTLSVNAQDTIFYKTKESVVVIVKEVSPTEVHYKKANMPDGPMYIVSKSDIAKIVYKNGYTELIKETEAPINTANQPLTVTYAPPINLGPPTITYDDTKRRYRSLVNLIDRHPDPNRRPALMSAMGGMRHLKAGQDATRTIAIVFGGITLASGALAGLIYLADPYSSDGFAAFPIAFGSVALISTAAAITINVNLKKKRHAFVDLYNR